MDNQERDAVRSFYDKEAARYIATRYVGGGADNLAWRARADLVLEILGPANGLVVDLGCGPGVLTPRLARQAERVVCADLSLEMVREGRRAYGDSPSVAWISCDIAHIPLRDATVDALLVIGVFGLAADPRAALAEFARVVAPAGRLLLQVPNALSPRLRIERRVKRVASHAAYEARLSQASISPRPCAPQTIEAMLRDAGFTPANRRFYDFRVPGLGQISPAADASVSAALHRRLTSRRRLGALGEGLVVEARR